ncbi:MAG: cytochrome c biogenesis protein DipZ [Candidatus Magasanikbacteria bacterium]|nr:cytochrome c biogenesis protein DipZ [Candidatus Magasanikbacteria bacterium]
MLQIIFSFLAGALTIGAPCILPMLPIILGASVGHTSKTRPLFITLGFVATFSVAGLTLSLIVQKLMIAPDLLRNIAVAGLAIFGLLMLFPRIFEVLAQRLSGLSTQAQQISQKAGSKNFGGFVLGAILGLIWTPCAGPILGSILTLIATQSNFGQAAVLLVAYSAGAGVPMIAISYGGQAVTTKVRSIAKYTNTIQKLFGGIILLLAAAMYFQYDLKLQAKILEYYSFPALEEKLIRPRLNNLPASNVKTNSSTTTTDLPNYGQAPDFKNIISWINTDKNLTMNDLKGKVVLVDFWTYSCINCIRTLPYVTSWYEKYKDQGFVVIGVHTPEFEFEKVLDNVKTATKRYGINYPVVLDNNFGTWNNYNNHYWPAHYLIDRDGNIRYYHFGEGKYEETESNIASLLGMKAAVAPRTEEPAKNIRTPEIYFGTDRLEYLTNSQSPSASGKQFSLPTQHEENHFALQGMWKFDKEYVELAEGAGIIKMKFFAGKIHMVAEASKPIIVQITVDGKKQKPVTISVSDLYTLFDSNNYASHEIIIEIPEAGLEVYTFTFG